MATIHSILLVEDDPPLRELYRLFLTDKGYTVIVAVDGDEALSAARESAPDLILLDVMMPKKNGFEVLHLLRSDPSYHAVHSKIVILTNLGRDRLPDDVKPKINGYIVKAEIELQDLIKIIKSLE